MTEPDAPTYTQVARTKLMPPQSVELPPVPECHLSYTDEAVGLDIDVWVRAELPYAALADRARRAVAEAVKPEIARA